MARVVIDPGVLVSAALSRNGPPAQLWRAVVDGSIEIVVCPHLIAELAGVLERPKFRDYLTDAEARAYVTEVARRARNLPDPTERSDRGRDPDDDYLLVLAGSGRVVALISGDRDLTDIDDNDPPIMTPAQAVDRFL